jgi:hypothetical protein
MAKGSAYVGGANTLLNAIGQYQRAGGFNSLAPGGSSTYYAPDNIDIGGGMNPIKYG